MNFSEYGNEVILEAEELRAIIRGEIGFRRCPDCQGDSQSWTLHYILADDPDQDNEQFKEVSAQFAADFDEDNLPPQYSFGECHLYSCETCHGVGYVPVEHL
jgi:hypothetical protein